MCAAPRGTPRSTLIQIRFFTSISFNLQKFVALLLERANQSLDLTYYKQGIGKQPSDVRSQLSSATGMPSMIASDTLQLFLKPRSVGETKTFHVNTSSKRFKCNTFSDPALLAHLPVAVISEWNTSHNLAVPPDSPILTVVDTESVGVT